MIHTNNTDIRALLPEALEEYLVQKDLPKYRAKQIFEWLHLRRANSFDEMSNIPKDLRISLSKDFAFPNEQIVKKLVSKKDGTRKYLVAFADGNTAECVLMKYKYGNSLCISTQVGCKMGCSFCASTLAGFVRNLSAAEMLSQVYLIERESGEKVNNIVLMGIGEPLDNFTQVNLFIELISHSAGKNLGKRHITLSTCGIIDKITLLADLQPQVGLAISLHNPFDTERSALMPINKISPVAELIKACDRYIETTNRQVTVEYALISGVNDSVRHAEALSDLVKNKLYHVNLIPVNEVKETPFTKSDDNFVKAFLKILIKSGVSATVRRKLGDDIDAACGQLRREN